MGSSHEAPCHEGSSCSSSKGHEGDEEKGSDEASGHEGSSTSEGHEGDEEKGSHEAPRHEGSSASKGHEGHEEEGCHEAPGHEGHEVRLTLVERDRIDAILRFHTDE